MCTRCSSPLPPNAWVQGYLASSPPGAKFNLYMEHKWKERPLEILVTCLTLMMFHGHGFELHEAVWFAHTYALAQAHACLGWCMSASMHGRPLPLILKTISMERHCNVQHMTKIFQALSLCLSSTHKLNFAWGGGDPGLKLVPPLFIFHASSERVCDSSRSCWPATLAGEEDLRELSLPLLHWHWGGQQGDVHQGTYLGALQELRCRHWKGKKKFFRWRGFVGRMVIGGDHYCLYSRTSLLNFNYPNTSVNQMPDLCCHAPFPRGHVALSDHHLFISCSYRALTERLNERMLICLICWHSQASKDCKEGLLAGVAWV